MTQHADKSAKNAAKRAVAVAALDYLRDGMIVGVGTGSTVNHFIDALAAQKFRLQGAVSSSNATSRRLAEAGYRVIDLNRVERLELYVDGADEANHELQLIKGGGGALTREKIVAEAAERFVCMIDESKLVDRLGAFPLPIEVIPMARELVTRRLRALDGRPEVRRDYVTDDGNEIVDVRDLRIAEPAALEQELNQIPGVVSVGLFARRPADVLLVGRVAGDSEGDDGEKKTSDNDVRVIARRR